MKDEFHLYKPNGLHNDWMSSILVHSRSEQCFQPPAITNCKAKTLKAAGTVSESCSAWVSATTKRWHHLTTLLVAAKTWLTFGADMSKPLRCAQVDGSAKKHCFKTYNYIVFRHYWSLKNIFLDPPSTRKNDGFTVLPRISVLFHMFGYFFGWSR